MEDVVKLFSNGCGELHCFFLADLDPEDVMKECIGITGKLELPIVSLLIQYPSAHDLLEKYKNNIRVYRSSNKDLCDLNAFLFDRENIDFALKYMELYDHFCGFGIRRYLEYVVH